MTKHALRTILRMPLRTLVCIILIAASALFTSLGTAMLSSSASMERDADSVYTTTATITCDYDEDSGTSSSDYYLSFTDPEQDGENQETEADGEVDGRFNIAQLIESPYCLGFDRRYSLGGYFEGKEIVSQFKPLDDLCIVRLKMGEFDERFGQRVTITDVLYQGNMGIITLMDGSVAYLHGDLIVNLMDGSVAYWHGNSEDPTYDHLIPGRYYYVHAYVSRGQLLPVSMPTEILGSRYVAYANNVFWDCTDWDGVSPSPQYNMFKLLARSYSVINNTITVNATTDFTGLAEYINNAIMLKDGRLFTQQEYDEHAKSIIISETLATMLDVELGDTLPLSLFTKDGYGYRSRDFTQENAFLLTDEYTIVGVLKKNNEFSTTVYIPTPPAELLPSDISSAEIGTLIIKNGSGAAFLAQFEATLPDSLEVIVYDHGYEAAIRPIIAMRDTAILLTAAGAGCALVLIIVTAFISMRRLRETADILRKLGTRRIRVVQYMLTSAFLLSVIGGAGGAVGAYYAFEPVTERAYASAQDEYEVDERYSGAYVALSDISFTPDIKRDVKVIAFVSGAVAAASAFASLIFAIAITGAQNKAPGQGFGAFLRRLSFGWRVALRSIRRRPTQSLAAALVVIILVSFVGWFGGEIANADKKLNEIYESTEVTASITSGRSSNIRIYDKEIQLVMDTGFVKQAYLSSTQIGRVTGYFKPGAASELESDSPSEITSSGIVSGLSGIGYSGLSGIDYGGYGDKYSDGYRAGYRAGYDYGFVDGYSDKLGWGFDYGYDYGYGDGYDYGYGDGFDDGYDDEFGDGFDDGFDDGRSEEYMAGYEDGHKDGYRDGYSDGYRDESDPSDPAQPTTEAFVGYTDLNDNLVYGDRGTEDDILVWTQIRSLRYAFKTSFVNDILYAPEFIGYNNVNIEFLEGYDLSMFSGYDEVCALSREYMKKRNLSLGDKVRVSVFFKQLQGEYQIDFDVTIAACYDSVRETSAGGNSESIVYLPIELFPNGEVFEEPSGIIIGTPNEYGVIEFVESVDTIVIDDYYSSAVFTLGNTRNLSEFRDKLMEAGFAIKGGSYKIRLTVAIDDTKLNNAVTAFLKHQKLMTVLYYAMFIIAAGMGFGISCLLTKGRKQEAAILRGLGTGWFSTLRVYVLEQLLLCIIGALLGGGVIYLITGGVFDSRLMGVGFVALCYLAGNLISIIMMNRLNVLKMLSAKE